MTSLFRCDICWFEGKSTRSLIYHLKKDSCGEHNRRKIVNGVKYRICRSRGCDEIAKYSNDRIPLRCKFHKEIRDCLSRAQRCDEDECTKQPLYGCAYRRKKERCGTHKLKNDVNLNYK